MAEQEAAAAAALLAEQQAAALLAEQEAAAALVAEQEAAALLAEQQAAAALLLAQADVTTAENNVNDALVALVEARNTALVDTHVYYANQAYYTVQLDKRIFDHRPMNTIAFQVHLYYSVPIPSEVMTDLVLVNSHAFDTSTHLSIPDAIPAGLFDGAVQHPLTPVYGDGVSAPLVLTFFIDESKWTDGFWDEIESSIITDAYHLIGTSNAALQKIIMDTAVVDEYGSQTSVLQQAMGTKVIAQTTYDLLLNIGTTTVLNP